MTSSHCDFAWAAGLFDGEGSTSTYIPKGKTYVRRQMAVSQGGLPGQVPVVAVDAVGEMLWPHLSSEKREQFAAAATRMKRAVPGSLGDNHGRTSEFAWAAGLFNGEGTFGAYANARMKPSWRGVSMSIPRASATVVPEVLLRFRAAAGVGSVTGPRMVPSPWSRLPQYRWQATGRHVCSAAIKVIWPWLGPVKRAEIRVAMQHLDSDVEEWMTDLTA